MELMKNYALRFISGKYQGGEFPLSSEAEIIIGRSSDLDMVLVEDMVSRRHAKLYVNGDQIVVQDLGSTNGTFVNGERIKRARLSEGDRILIGTSILKLVTVPAGSQKVDPNFQLEEMAAYRRTGQMHSMSGNISEIPLPDLLQLFGSSKKSGTLVVRTEVDVGKLFLSDGTIVSASINDSKQLSPEKCVYRVITWRDGTFYMEPAGDQVFDKKLDLSTEAALLESFRIVDEIQRMAPLPSMKANLSLVIPLEAELKELSGEELDVLQYAINHSLVQAVFNNCPYEDITIAKHLTKLIEKEYLVSIELTLQES
ncbi:MAG: FHA domain-containing protein [Deltaproteobacteria bacterium]|nr:FHA domain-containing protein [Deltaproteobacteria bacterium]